MTPRRCVSAVIVTYSSADHIGSCLNALRTTADEWLQECVVVDNASADDTCRVVRERFPWATLIANAENVGFGRGVNLGAQRASGEYLLILNPDTIVGENAVAELTWFLEHRAQAAACGPGIWSLDGRFRYASRRGFPTPLSSLGYLLRLDRLFSSSRRIAGYQQRYLSTNQEMTTDCLSGSCMLVRRDAFVAVGGFDEDYFLFGEDIDLCWKLKRAGHEIWYIPSARVVHVQGASVCLAPVRSRHEFYRSMMLFLDKRLRGGYSPFTLALAKTGIRLAGLINLRRVGRRSHNAGMSAAPRGGER